MKRLIIAVAFLFGAVAGTPVTPFDRAHSIDSGTAREIPTPGGERDSRQLSADETADIAGGGIMWCWTFLGEDEDTYLICCSDIWVMTICVGANLSAWEREFLQQ